MPRARAKGKKTLFMIFVLHKPDRQEHTGKSILISAHNAKIAFDVKKRVSEGEEPFPSGRVALSLTFFRRKKTRVFMQSAPAVSSSDEQAE